MLLFANYYITFGFLSVFFFLIFYYCRNVFQKYKVYPIMHLIPYVFYRKVIRKIPKDVSMTSFAFKEMYEECIKHMKEGVCFTYSTSPILLIFGEESIKVFSNEKSVLNKPDMVYVIAKDFLGPGLVTNSGEKWKKHRKMINPAFSLGMLKDKIPLFNDHAEAFVKDVASLVGKPTTKLTDLVKYHYFNALIESVFGFKETEENKDERIKYFQNLDCSSAACIFRILHPWLRWKFLLNTFSYGRQILRAHEELFIFTKNVILKMKDHISSNATVDPECFSTHLRKSFTYILLQHHLNDPSFTFEDLYGEVSNFVAAGYDTVSYSTMWCLFTLGLYPEIQEKAYNEVQFASTDSYISFDDCANFTYLEAVILESMRLYPTIPIFARQLTQDVQCGKYKVPKNTVLGFFIYALHRNPNIYPDPEKFDPERFLGIRQNASTYIPFSEGIRNCIGKKYALLEMKIFLAHFLRNFKITSLDKRENIGLAWSVILMPVKPFRMYIEFR